MGAFRVEQPLWIANYTEISHRDLTVGETLGNYRGKKTLPLFSISPTIRSNPTFIIRSPVGAQLFILGFQKCNGRQH